MSTGILNHKIVDTPVAIIDFETTGLSPGRDRVVEVSVVRKNPGEAPCLVFDTLINPQRPVAATEIHGISDADVKDAPQFEEIAGNFLDALSDCVVSAYNVYFDMRFFEYEMTRVGCESVPPYFCLMYMRPLLSLGKRVPLGEACLLHDVAHEASHVGSADVLACAKLYDIYLEKMRDLNVETFRDLRSFKKYKFLNTFSALPLDGNLARSLKKTSNLRSRCVSPITRVPESKSRLESKETGRSGLVAYWDALRTVLDDLVITDEEIEFLEQTQRQSGLTTEQVRMLHARIFASVIDQFIDDQWLDDKESERLRRLHQCLRRLGWAPGA